MLSLFFLVSWNASFSTVLFVNFRGRESIQPSKGTPGKSYCDGGLFEFIRRIYKNPLKNIWVYGLYIDYIYNKLILIDDNRTSRVERVTKIVVFAQSNATGSPSSSRCARAVLNNTESNLMFVAEQLNKRICLARHQNSISFQIIDFNQWYIYWIRATSAQNEMNADDKSTNKIT